MTGHRTVKTRVKTARKRKASSTRWLQRQLNDPYVQMAKKEGYRSRAAYKLAELDDKFKILKPGKTVLDLGAAPGGWSQVAAFRIRSANEAPRLVAVDILPMDPVAGVVFLQQDFMQDNALAAIRRHFPSSFTQGVDVVLSDIAPNTTGHTPTDHLRLMAILEEVYDFSCRVLKPNGTLVAKVFQGGTEKELLTRMKRDFEMVKHAKPKASRSDSAEIYVVAMGFKGTAK